MLYSYVRVHMHVRVQVRVRVRVRVRECVRVHVGIYMQRFQGIRLSSEFAATRRRCWAGFR